MVSTSKKVARLAIAASFAVIAVMLANPAAAKSTVIQNVSTDVISGQVLSCDGDVVTISGGVHNVFHITIDSLGGVHIDIISAAQGNGDGASGTDYNYHGHTEMTGNIQVGGKYEVTANQATMLVSSGSSVNSVFRYDQHFTVLWDGTVTSEVLNVRTTC